MKAVEKSALTSYWKSQYGSVKCCSVITTGLLNLTDSSVKLSANLLLLLICCCSAATAATKTKTRVTDKSSLPSLKEENFRRQHFFLYLYDCERIRKQ